MRFSRGRVPFVIASLSLILGACVGESPARNPHDAVPAPPAPFAGRARTPEAVDVSARILTNHSDSQLIDELRTQLAALDISRIARPDVARGAAQADRLRRVNRATLELVRRRSPVLNSHRFVAADGAGRDGTLFELYEWAALQGCDSSMRGCRFLGSVSGPSNPSAGYFAQDPDSAHVLLALSERASSARDRYRHLMAAFSVKNASPNRRLEDAYMSGYGALMREIRERPLPGDQRLTESVGRTVSQIFQLRRDFAGSEAWLDELEPWSASRRGRNEFGEASFDAFRFATRQGAYGLDGNPRPSLKRAIEAARSDEDSILKRAERVNPTLSKHFEIASLGPFDEYAFIVDRVFRGHLSPQDGGEAWRSTRRDRERLAAAMKAYVQIEFALAIQESNTTMAEYLRERIAVTVNEAAFAKILGRSQVLGPLWKEHFLKGCDSLQELAGMAFANDGRLDLGDSIARSMDELFLGLRRNIKKVAVVPQMILLTYFMGLYDLRREFTIWWWTVTIRPERMVNELFRGTAEPWFDFGNDQSIPAAHEVFHSYHYLLASGALETWGVTPEALFEMISRKLIGGRLRRLLAKTDELNAPFQTTEWDSIRRICDARKVGAPYPFASSIGDVRNGGFLGEGFTSLQRSIGTHDSITRTVGSATLMERAKGFNPHASFVNETSEMVRLELDPTLEKIRRLLEIHRAFLSRDGKSPDEIATAIAPLQAKYDEYKGARDQWLRSYYLARDRFDSCYFSIAKHALDVDTKLLQAEGLHLRAVHRDIKQLRAGTLSSEQIARKYEFDLPGGYKGTSRISTDGYFMTPVDFKIRVAGYLQNGIRIEGAEMGPVEPNVHISIPPNVLDSREATEYNTPTTVGFVESEDDFVSAALRANNSSGQFQLWFAEFRLSLQYWGEWQMGMALHYRLGPVASADGRTSFETPVSELIETPLKLIQVLELMPAQDAILRMLGRYAIVSRTFIPDILVQRITREPTPFFDNVFIWTGSEYLSAVGVARKFPPINPYETLAQPTPDMEPVLETAKNYAVARALRDSFTFAAPIAVERAIETYHRERVKTDLERASAFETEAAERERRDLASGANPRFRWNTVDPVAQPRYLSPTLREIQRAAVDQFHSDTSGCFSSDQTQRSACSW